MDFFGIYLTVFGAVLMFLAFAVFYKYLIMEKRCSAKVKGVVKGYRCVSDNGIALPVVYYTVNNQEYKVVGPEYSWYVTKSITTPFSKNTMSYEEKPNGVFVVNRTSNSFFGVQQNPIAELYPINTELDVFYDPNKPKLAYVLRCPKRKWMFYLTFFSAIFVWIMNLVFIFYFNL